MRVPAAQDVGGYVGVGDAEPVEKRGCGEAGGTDLDCGGLGLRMSGRAAEMARMGGPEEPTGGQLQRTF